MHCRWLGEKVDHHRSVWADIIQPTFMCFVLNLDDRYLDLILTNMSDKLHLQRKKVFKSCQLFVFSTFFEEISFDWMVKAVIYSSYAACDVTDYFGLRLTCHFSRWQVKSRIECNIRHAFPASFLMTRQNFVNIQPATDSIEQEVLSGAPFRYFTKP